MTNNEAINILLIHSVNWSRLIEEKICGMKEGKEAVQALDMAINALEQEPCDDCVSRDAVLEALYDHEYKKDIRKDIEALPPVQPKQRTGRWIEDGEGFLYPYECSNCGSVHDKLFNFCPSCGEKKDLSEWEV